jgi:hypothetical protein
MKAKLAAVVGTVLVIIMALGCWMIRVISRTTEPDPARFPIEVAQKQLQRCDIEAQISKLLYVNVDYNGFIFRGKVQSINGKLPMIVGINFEQLIESKPNGRLPCFGFIRIKRNHNENDLVGVILSTTKSEAKLGSVSFDEKWREFVNVKS